MQKKNWERVLPGSLQTKIILLVCIVVAISLLVTNILISVSVSKNTEESIGKNAVNMAKTIAKMPTVIDGLTGKEPEENIQKIAGEILASTNVHYVVVTDMNGIRKSHPVESRIGERYFGEDGDAAFLGNTYYSVGRGTLGYALRAFSPVYTDAGQMVGVVSVGILLDDVRKAVEQSKKTIFLAPLLGLLVGVAGAVMLARSIKKTMFGLEPSTIARMLEERIAMLQSVREGIVAVDNRGVITVVNNEAKRILSMAGVQDDPVGKLLKEEVPATRFLEVLQNRTAELDVEQEMNGVSVIANCTPLIINNRVVGAVATFREKREVWQMAQDLTGVKNYIEALRAQAHEFMNKLHVILGMTRMQCYDELTKYVQHVAQNQEAEVNFVGRRIREPVMAGFILGKLSMAREKGVVMALSEESYLPPCSNPQVVHELVTVLGNLVDNALDAVQACPVKKVDIGMQYREGQMLIMVGDTGAGIRPERRDLIFNRGFSTKKGKRGQGLTLILQSLDRLKGQIEFTSGPGEGSCFWVKVPYQTEGGKNHDQGNDC